ncbi:hypothetical protein W97_05006 [Coniosporium apollinis CBS 100218]|uniref:Uncharacterized protein n=1 Tax=Coniosporium apollinis (strain CBS 100218) TaxID=1168221 RepID=R7YV31_CONA1|nr:uncharacterized protein W97_05006 [Coniosporium apollinis CBS 100218]EON65767.1 hypothetical protein W97_05006 [Coniosporium apollinis CBS 100218]
MSTDIVALSGPGAEDAREEQSPQLVPAPTLGRKRKAATMSEHGGVDNLDDAVAAFTTNIMLSACVAWAENPPKDHSLPSCLEKLDRITKELGHRKRKRQRELAARGADEAQEADTEVKEDGSGWDSRMRNLEARSEELDREKIQVLEEIAEAAEERAKQALDSLTTEIEAKRRLVEIFGRQVAETVPSLNKFEAKFREQSKELDRIIDKP